MQRKHVKPGGPKAALMRAVAALPALNDDGDPNGRRVAAEAAYAVANQYKSLQTLIEAAERCVAVARHSEQ